MGVNGIYGLSGSGLDIESMVKVGMMSKQAQLDKMQQNYTKNDWKKEAFLDIYKDIEDFNLKKLTDYKLSSNMNARSATSSSDVIKATANGAAPVGTYTIEVSATATKAYLDGHAQLDFGNDSDLKVISLSNVKLSGNDTATFTLTGAKDTANIEINSSTTIYDLVSQVNKSGTGVNAIYDSAQGTFSFYTPNTGSDATIAISSTDPEALYLLNAMQLYDVSPNSGTGKIEASATSSFTSATTISASGTNAVVLVDGKPISDELTKSNSFTVKGVTFNISNVTKKTTAVVNVDQDTEKIVENVKSFVDEYNELLDKIYDAYREAPNSSYKPLTDAQKAEMTEDQIKKWEEKAKSGMLYHDQTLRKIIDSVRTSVTSKVTESTSDYDSVYKLGITTKGMYGELQLDEDKLREALKNDSNAVYNVFANPNAKKSDSNSEGVAVRLSTALSNATKSIETVAGRDASTSSDSTLNTLLKSMQQRISNFKKTMQTFEDNLYKKYDAMESALAGLGSQMSYLSSMFAS